MRCRSVVLSAGLLTLASSGGEMESMMESAQLGLGV
jgi:hypothetical protein